MEFKDWLNNQFSDWRGDTRLTVKDFAEYIGVSQQVMSSWLNGTIPTIQGILKLAKILGPRVFVALGLPEPNNLTKVFYVATERIPPATFIEWMEELETQLKELGIVNQFDRDNMTGKFLREKGVDLFKTGYEWTGRYIEDPDLEYIKDNWVNLPEEFKKKLRKDIKKVIELNDNIKNLTNKSTT